MGDWKNVALRGRHTALVQPSQKVIGHIVLLVLRDNVRLFVPFAHGQPGQTVLLVLRDNVRLFVPAFLGQ
jgi:hypothetical protein